MEHKTNFAQLGGDGISTLTPRTSFESSEATAGLIHRLAKVVEPWF